ncbi:MAG: hypothetical protein HBSAPP03_18280 [Phycisphaerae bacterium]|nr:MAG: hypothetical protein HBSAPP03_18280 [Phycisphaerae bacterium]
MAHDTTPSPAAFDELDPHHSGVHASHVIVGPMQLRAVLAVLLVFTAMTVGFAQAEQWASAYFGVVLPHWVNVAGAMSIATIKALLVMAIFMQLKYDNPVNTLIMGVTLAALAIFICFTGMDLFNRSQVYDWKAGPIVAGGTGGQLWGGEGISENKAITTPVGESVALHARNEYLKRLRDKIKATHPELDDAALEAAALAQFEADKAATVGHGHGGHASHADTGNTANRSRPRRGLSGALDTAATGNAHAAPAH